MRPVPRRLVAVVSAMALSAGLLSVATGPPAEAASPAKTSKIEKRRSKAVKTPKIKWHTCYKNAKCATVKVPLDYDKPKGQKVSIAVLKRTATNKKKKIGTLFVNPGGPGGSGTDMAYYADEYLSSALRKQFDIVGFDPRGVASSTNVKCFTSQKKADAALKPINSVSFPVGATEEKAVRGAYDKLATACSSAGKPLSGASSTAEVARDMDLLRRAVGDKKLNYLGFSYGSYLGEVYANLYPDRVRAIAIDGVLDPVKWTGTTASQSTPIGMRVESAQGSSKALRQALVLCGQAGPTKCQFADGDPVAKFDTIAQALRQTPLVLTDEEDDFTLTYATFVSFTLTLLYFQDGGPDLVTNFASDVWDALYPPVPGKAAETKQVAARSIITLQKAVEKRQHTGLPGASYGSYDNGDDVFATIGCTDSLNSKNLASFGSLAETADQKAPYFGRLWLWNLAGCSSKNWTVKDEDAYRGPFSKRTSSPVLVVGNYWDPATNYAGAVSTSKLMPNSRLLSSNSWGHTAYGTSKCATSAIDSYLLSKKLPAKGKVCTGDYRPFSDVLDGSSLSAQAKALNKKPIAVAPVRPGLR